MQSKAQKPEEYLLELPEDRRKEINIVRRVILENLPKGYEEVMQYGMLAYVVPLSVFPEGYLGKKDTPLPYAALASQKNFMSLYLMDIYSDKGSESWFQKEFKASGKKLDMGKSCVRFKNVEDVALEVVGQAIARTPVSKYIEIYKKSRAK